MEEHPADVDVGAMAPPGFNIEGAIAPGAEHAAANEPAILDLDGVLWEHINHVAVDAVGHHARRPSLQWARAFGQQGAEIIAEPTIFDCFRLFFPEQYLNTIIDVTNRSIRADASRVGGDLNRGEFC